MAGVVRPEEGLTDPGTPFIYLGGIISLRIKGTQDEPCGKELRLPGSDSASGIYEKAHGSDHEFASSVIHLNFSGQESRKLEHPMTIGLDNSES